MSTQSDWDEFWQTYQWPDPPMEPEYRLYYDDHGLPIAYTTQDMPGKYIVVTAHQHALADRRVRVRDGQIQPYRPGSASKLCPSTVSGVPCHVQDVTVVVSEHVPHQKWTPT